MIKCKKGEVEIDGQPPEIMADIAVVLIALIRKQEVEHKKSFIYMAIIKTVLTAMERA